MFLFLEGFDTHQQITQTHFSHRQFLLITSLEAPILGLSFFSSTSFPKIGYFRRYIFFKLQLWL
jgi:hypothetical protein